MTNIFRDLVRLLSRKRAVISPKVEDVTPPESAGDIYDREYNARGTRTDCVSPDYIAKWNGDAWAAARRGSSNVVTAPVVYQDGTIYVLGEFKETYDTNTLRTRVTEEYEPAPSFWNCRYCGARNTVDDLECRKCGAPSNRGWYE